jgi:hypothetical protein
VALIKFDRGTGSAYPSQVCEVHFCDGVHDDTYEQRHSRRLSLMCETAPLTGVKACRVFSTSPSMICNERAPRLDMITIKFIGASAADVSVDGSSVLSSTETV